MAPEIWRGEQSDAKVDVYAYGVVLWELFTGERAWSELGDLERLRKRVGHDGVTLDVAKVPMPARNIVGDCFLYRAAQRPEFQTIVSRLPKLSGQMK